MDQTETNAVDSRIAAVISRRAGASSTAQFPITRTEGTEPVRNRMPKGSVDATVKFSTVVEPERSKAIKPADELNENHPEPNSDEAITIGDTVIRPNMIAGTWEGRLTAGGNAAHEVLVNGVRVIGDGAVSAVYEALRLQQNAKKGAK